jgi:regulator of chromosome condensation
MQTYTRKRRAKSPEPAPATRKRVTKENKPVKPAAPAKAKAKATATKANTTAKTKAAATKSKSTARKTTKATPAKAEPQTDAEDERPRKRVKQDKPTEPAGPPVPLVYTNPLNPLPTPSEHARPAALLYYWGAGNFGQFGMGPDILDEFGKPKKHTWVEKGIEEGKFGEKGAGIEAAAAGGLHTMFLDEKGRVNTSTSLHFIL